MAQWLNSSLSSQMKVLGLQIVLHSLSYSFLEIIAERLTYLSI